MNRPPPVLLSMMGIGLHLMVLVGLPLVLARFCLRVSESSSVLATSGVLGLIVGLYLSISLGLLVIGAGIMKFRMLWYRRLVDGMGAARVLGALERKLNFDPRAGWPYSYYRVVSAVSLSWAALGVMAALSLFVFYGLLGCILFLVRFRRLRWLRIERPLSQIRRLRFLPFCWRVTTGTHPPGFRSSAHGYVVDHRRPQPSPSAVRHPVCHRRPVLGTKNGQVYRVGTFSMYATRIASTRPGPAQLPGCVRFCPISSTGVG